MTGPAPRVPWPPGFPDVVVQQPHDSPVRLKDQPGYIAAKRMYDIDAAWAVVEALVDPSRLALLRACISNATPTLVAVQADEGGRNALPEAYAEHIAHALGLPVGRGIVQINRTFPTGADSVHRLMTRAAFDGPVQPGQTYVIVDDVVTQGGTLADLRGYIEANGGKVIAATTLIGSTGSHVMALRPETLAALQASFGTVEAEYHGAFGHGYEGLTESEARAIGRFGMVDAFRDRVIAPAAARRAAAAGGTAGGEAIGGSRGDGIAETVAAPPPPTVPTFHRPPTVRNGAHHYFVRVYFEDTDAAGVVYYANYLKYAERARTEALRDLAAPHAALTADHGLIFMVRRAKLDYLGPARLDDSLVVVTRPLAVGAATVELRQSFHHAAQAEAGRALVVADIQLACVRQSDLRPVRMPPRWRTALAVLTPGLA